MSSIQEEQEEQEEQEDGQKERGDGQEEKEGLTALFCGGREGAPVSRGAMRPRHTSLYFVLCVRACGSKSGGRKQKVCTQVQ